MRKFFSIIMLSLMTACAMSEEKFVDKDVKVDDFEKIEIKGSMKVIFRQDNLTSVRIHGLKEGVDNVVISQEGNSLVVSQKGTNVNGLGDIFRAIKKASIDEALVVYVTSPDLISVNLSGSGDFKMRGNLDTDNLRVSISGSGDIDFNHIVCNNLDVELQGSGDIEIESVDCVSANYSVRGSGDIEAKQQNVQKTEVSVAGSGDIELKCKNCDVVNANVSGSGDIKLFGNIRTLNKSVRGTGDIIVK